jgi:hypothetical protein
MFRVLSQRQTSVQNIFVEGATKQQTGKKENMIKTRDELSSVPDELEL